MPARHGPGPDPACPPGRESPSGVPTHHYPARVGSPPALTPPARWVRGPRPPLLRLGRGSHPPRQGFLRVLAPPDRTPPKSGSLPAATRVLVLAARPVGSPGSSPPLPGLGSRHASTPPTWGVLSPGRRRLSEPGKSGVAAAVAGPPPRPADPAGGRLPLSARAGPEHR